MCLLSFVPTCERCVCIKAVEKEKGKRESYIFEGGEQELVVDSREQDEGVKT